MTFSGSAISEYSSAIGDTTEEVQSEEADEDNEEDGDDADEDDADEDADGVILVSSAEDFYGASAVTTTVTTTVTAIEVIHVDESGKETNYESVAAVETEVSSIEFDTDSFSDFCLVQVVEGSEESAYDVTTNEGVLSSGTYKLTADVNLGAASENSSDGTAAASDTTTEGNTTGYDLTVPSGTTVTLDLNGYTLTGTGDGSVITVYGTFTLTDSAATTDSDGDYTSGTITGGTGTTNSEGTGTFGGGIAVFSGTFTMKGGTISGNTATYSGGGVFVYNGTFTMNGGAISDNSASAYDGGGVYIQSSTFTMNDGEISGNTGRYGGGISVYPGTFVMKGGTISGNTAKSSTSTSVNGYGGGVYAYSSSAEITINGGTISSNTAYLGGGLYIQNSSLTMTDGTVTSNTASSGSTDGSGGGIDIQAGTFTMSGGTITSNTAGNRGGGVYVLATSSASASMTMTGGTISNNEAYRNGGGISISTTYESGENTATLTLSDGNITGNTVTVTNSNGSGGGVGVNAGAVFEMTGGTISGNSAWYGGGVDLGECSSYECGSSFSMSGGTISNNTATLYGGGVAVGSYLFSYLTGSFTMSGGTISDNTVGGAGGGVAVNYGSSFTLSGGTISDNKAGECGGGIYIHQPYTLTLKNVVVTDNTASIIGGGVWACPHGSIALYISEGGAIYDNTAAASADSAYTAAGSSIAYVEGDGSPMTLSSRMLGGGALTWYYDGGITIEENANGTGTNYVGEGNTTSYARYSADSDSNTELTTLTNITESTALKSVTEGACAESLAMALADLVITGNSAQRGGGIASNGGLTIGNSTAETTSITVTKVWSDSNNVDGIRPESVTVYLYNTVTFTEEDEDGNTTTTTQKYLVETAVIEADEDGNWTYTFDDLPVDGSFSYSVEEAAVDDDYTAVITGGVQEDGTYSYTITNSHTPATKPGLAKTASDTDVEPGDTVTFTLTSNVPDDLDRYLADDETQTGDDDSGETGCSCGVEGCACEGNDCGCSSSDSSGTTEEEDETGDGETDGDTGDGGTDENGEDTETGDGDEGSGTDGDDASDTEDDSEEASYILTFHDVMSDIFSLNTGSFSVTVNGVALDSSLYTITTDTDDGCSFHVTMDLVDIYEAGSYFALSEIDSCPAIVVTYSATVSENASGTYRNTSWVGYEGGNSDPSTVKITVWDISKTATNLELDEDENSDYYGDYLSQVTLSVPSAGYEGNLDVVLVLDGSTSSDYYDLASAASSFLEVLAAYENVDVQVGIVIFGGSTPILDYKDLMSISGTAGASNLSTLQSMVINKEYDGYSGRSGSNLQAGVVKAQEILDADTETDSQYKYMIILSDGGARMWYEDGSAYSVTYTTDESTSIWWNSNEDHFARYKINATTKEYTDDSIEGRSFSDVWAAAEETVTRYGMTEAEKNNASKGDDGVASWSTVKDTTNDYYTTYEAATYMAATSIVESSTKENIIYVSYPYYSGALKTYTDSFKQWLADNGYVTLYTYDETDTDSAAEIFSDVEDELILLVGAGSVIIDEIGDSENDVDFDFVNGIDYIDLVVGATDDSSGTTMSKKLLSSNDSQTVYGFTGDSSVIESGSSDPTAYDYVLTYYPGGTTYTWDGTTVTYGECFKVEFNVPITINEKVDIIYSVVLDGDDAEAGAHGVYDVDGSLVAATDEDGDVIYRTLVLSGDNDWTGSFLIHSYDPNTDDGVVYSVCEVVEVLNEETGEVEEQEIEGYFADITAEATQEVETSGNGGTSVTLTSWSFMINNTPDTEVAVSKSGNVSTAEAGDTVKFTTVVNVPNYLATYASDDSFEVVVHDVMDEKFSYGEDLSIAVDDGTGSGTAIDAGLYTVSVSADDGCTFEVTIDLVALVNAGLLEADEDGNYPDLVLTYTATLAEDADAGTYDNTTWATYVKDGEDKSTGESTWTVNVPEEPEEDTEEEDEEETTTSTTSTTTTSVSTGALAIIKVDAETGARLAGATFALYNDTEGTLIGYYKTDSNGYLVTSQLTLNYTYSFVEVGAPDGYVLDSTPHTVTLTSALSSSADSPYVLTISNTAESSVLDADRGDETDGTEDGAVLGTGRDAVSETGDDSNVLFWLVLMLAAGAGLAAAIAAAKRRRI